MISFSLASALPRRKWAFFQLQDHNAFQKRHIKRQFQASEMSLLSSWWSGGGSGNESSETGASASETGKSTLDGTVFAARLWWLNFKLTFRRKEVYLWSQGYGTLSARWKAPSAKPWKKVFRYVLNVTPVECVVQHHHYTLHGSPARELIAFWKPAVFLWLQKCCNSVHSSRLPFSFFCNNPMNCWHLFETYPIAPRILCTPLVLI